MSSPLTAPMPSALPTMPSQPMVNAPPQEMQYDENIGATIVWNISGMLANVACAPFIRAATIRQVHRGKTSDGWRPLAMVLAEEEGMLAGWRGYLARGISVLAQAVYTEIFDDFDNYNNWTGFLWLAPLTGFVLTPFNVVQARRTLDLGIPLSSAKSDDRDDAEPAPGEAPGRWRTLRNGKRVRVQQYDGIWDIVCQVYEKEGITGFWRGCLPSTLKLGLDNLHLFQWMVLFQLFQNEAETILGLGFVVSSELLKYPCDLLIQRQMIDLGGKNMSLWERIKHIWNKEGISGFYNGFLSYDYLIGKSCEWVSTGLIAFILSVAAELSLS